jgi:arylsulfatase A-like enzyme
MLESQHAGLVLLHMPMPHPWGFYDRRTGTFPDHRTSYLDNLALADAYVGHVRALLEQNGGWANSTVIIMGDHGWRTRAVWRRSGFWTAEEQRASHGGMNADRPAMIVKLPGQHEAARIDARFDAVDTRALIDAVLRGELQTPQQLSAWVQESSHSSSAPAGQ